MSGGPDISLRVVGDGIVSQRFRRNEGLEKVVGRVSNLPKKESFLPFGVVDAIGSEIVSNANAVRIPRCTSRVEGVERDVSDVVDDLDADFDILVANVGVVARACRTGLLVNARDTAARNTKENGELRSSRTSMTGHYPCRIVAIK